MFRVVIQATQPMPLGSPHEVSFSGWGATPKVAIEDARYMCKRHHAEVVGEPEVVECED